jgi:hypothetical protein
MPGDVVFHGELLSSHAQLSFGDHGDEYPQFVTGEEPLLAAVGLVVVATADTQISVDVRICDGERPIAAGQLVHDGPLAIGEAQIGTFVGTNLIPLDLPGGRYRVQVYVDRPGEASSVLFLCSEVAA